MQTIIIKVFNPIYEKWISRIDQKSRELIVGFIFVLLALYFPLCQSGCLQYLLYNETQRQLFAAVLLLAAALFSMQAPLKWVPWNPWIMLPLWLGGLGIFITGLMHSLGDGYFVFGIMLLTVYPCLYFVWINRGDTERLFDIVSWANVAVGLIYVLYSTALLRVYPWEVIVDGRVRGTLYNSNLYSMVGMAIACCALYLLYRTREQKAKQRFLLVAFIIGLIVTVAGQSRASILVVAGSIVITVIFAAKCGSISKRAVKTVIVVCCLLVICGGLFAVLQGGNAATAGEEGPQVSVLERFLPEGKDLNSYSSGRLGIWAFYAEHLNLLGNDFDLAEINSRFGVGHAHNNYLEYGYRCGVIVAGAFLLAELITLLFSLQYLFSKQKSSDYLLFCIIFMLTYVIESLIDVATIPMERYAPFFYYLLLAGMAGQKDGSTSDQPAPDSIPRELRIP